MVKEGDLCVWHIPQVPGKAFQVPVASVQEGKKVDKILCDYDEFELRNRIKGDYSNAGGLNVFEGGEWVSWYSEEGDDFDDFDVPDEDPCGETKCEECTVGGCEK